LRELRDVIPHVLNIQEKQLALAESERKTEQYQTLKTHHEEGRAAVEHALDVTRKKREAHRKNLMTEEQRSSEIGIRLRELSSQLTQLKLYEEQTGKLRALEKDLALLPKDPAEAVRQAQETFDHRVELGKVVPLLDRFAAARIELRKATERGETLNLAEKKTREAGEQAKK